MKETVNISSVYSEEVINERLSVLRVENGNGKNTFAEDVSLGLTSFPKGLHPKYFYDSPGSELFEQICKTPEYYVTRTEASILERYSEEIAQLNCDKKNIVELGSGSSIKTKYILGSFIRNSGSITYMPVDVSDIIVQSSKKLLDEFEGLSIKGIISEYEEGLEVINELIDSPKMILFLGSSIGNFTQYEASELLACISSIMNENDSFLIGFDLVKDIDVLNAAYDDSAGVTAKFNINILSRINKELGGNFDLSKFKHKAFFNTDFSRVEMHLESTKEQLVYMRDIDESIHFEEGETIHTENSYKFTDEMISELASFADLTVNKTWKDPENYFGLYLMKK
ncbi:MAG: L-histidine N(alpha)-methyltransferase [Chlorobi bacterium]|nr:L-histidine N(alpha)-methyltransferase [Chlorobiota bacterium]MCI0716562.1 L-histidine N(alpha)-methyltransferase [Chlorobiota bacterium]